jgi:cell division protein ZapA
MASKPERVDVRILEREYQLACLAEEKQALLATVRYVDERMKAIRDAGKISGTEKIAVMAALQIAGELLTTKTAGGELAIGELKRRMQAMNQVIDEALVPQANLF